MLALRSVAKKPRGLLHGPAKAAAEDALRKPRAYGQCNTDWRLEGMVPQQMKVCRDRQVCAVRAQTDTIRSQVPALDVPCVCWACTCCLSRTKLLPMRRRLNTSCRGT